MFKYFDNTRISTYKKCPRKYFFRHSMGWTREGTPGAALVFGSSWHAAMDVVWQRGTVNDAMENFCATWQEETGIDPMNLQLAELDQLGARTPMIAKEMLYAYQDNYKGLLQNSELVACELPFAVPLYPDADNTYWYVGRLDKVIMSAGDRLIIEHKTTTEYKIEGGFKNTWLNNWSPNAQVEGYMFSSHLLYEGGARRVYVDGALVHKKQRAFKMIPISSSPALLNDWLHEVRTWISNIDLSVQDWEGGLPLSRAFPRNTDQCIDKYSECQFRDICRFQTADQLSSISLETEPPMGFVLKRWEPFSTLGLDQIGLKRESENA